MDHKHITYVRMRKEGWHHKHVTHVGSAIALWHEMTVLEVIDSIETRRCLFTVTDKAGITRTVQVAKPNPLNKLSWYLRSQSADSPKDALLALPRYAEIQSRAYPAPRRVLAAVSPLAFPLLCDALGKDFEIAYCGSLSDASGLVNGPFDIVLGGTHFDESRMFDLVRLAKTNRRNKSVFVCIKILADDQDTTAYDPIGDAPAFAADGFIDLYRWRKELGADQAHEELRAVLEDLVQTGVFPNESACQSSSLS